LYKNLFEEYDIKAVVTSHNVYAEYGILCRLANQYGADVYLKDMKVFKLYDEKIHINEHFLKPSRQEYEEALSDEALYQKALEYLTSRLDGTADQIDVKNAYKNKTIYTKDNILDYFDLSRENKNVFILAHAFSDGPHVGGGLLFNDYYHWLVEAIKIMSTVKGVNVFVKPHPSSYMWSETGAVEEILSQLSIDNIHILPNDFNTNSIKDIADYLLTARGTAGLEFSCFGIPTITAAQGYYSGFGIAHEPKTRKEYENTLKSILKIGTLSEEVKKRAIIILYLSFQNYWHSDVLPRREILPGDDYDTLYKLQYKELSENLKDGKKMKDTFYDHVYTLAK
jgi:capsule polysaccharide export protein KpsC/LpsZ